MSQNLHRDRETAIVIAFLAGVALTSLAWMLLMGAAA